MELMNHNCGVYVTAGLSGSSRGEIPLELYAMLTTIGKKKWTENAHKIIQATRDTARAVNEIPGLKVFGNVDELVCVIAIGLDQEYWAGKKAPYIHAIGDELSKRLGFLNSIPEAFHLCITNNHASHPTYLTKFKAQLR